MSEANYYFKANKRSPLHAEVITMKAFEKNRAEKIKALADELCQKRDDGLEEVLMAYGSGRILGIKIRPTKGHTITWAQQEFVRPGWRFDRKERFMVPNLRTPEGKALRERMDKVGRNRDHQSDSCRIFGHDMIFHGMATWFAVFGWKGDNVVVRMGAPVLAKLKDKLKQFGLTEITATQAEKLIGCC